MQMKIVVAGASGMVGSELLKMALGDPEISEIVSLVRQPSGIDDPKLLEKTVNFEDLEKHKNIISGDAVFCCLGTTMKKAKTKENFKKVDYLFPLNLAKIARENNIPQFNIITAMGANKDSSIFYNRVKGEAEEAIFNLHFQSLNIYRPSLLKGQRNERRTGEKVGVLLAKFVDPFLVGRLRRFRSIKATDVASTMLAQAKNHQKGYHVLTSDQIYDIAEGY